MTEMVNLTGAQLTEAGQLKTQIEELQNRLAALLGGAPASVGATPGKRVLSPKAIAAIRKGQRERWDKVKAAKAAAAAAAAPAPVATAPVAAAA